MKTKEIADDEEVYINTVDGSVTFRNANTLEITDGPFTLFTHDDEMHIFPRQTTVQVAIRGQ